MVWSYSIPIKTPEGVLQEWGDATLLSNGNILFSRKTGAGLISPDKKLLWNFYAQAGTEIHVAQPIGLDRAFVVQNGESPKLMVWALRSWSDPADLGPATTIQLLDEPGKAEEGDLIR